MSAKMFLGNRYRSGAEHILREGCRCWAEFIGFNKGHIEPAGVLAETGMDATRPEA